MIYDYFFGIMLADIHCKQADLRSYAIVDMFGNEEGQNSRQFRIAVLVEVGKRCRRVI